MKSYFAAYSIPGSSNIECTVLVFDKNLSIGYRDDSGVNNTVNWLIADVESEFNAARQQTRVKNKKLQGQELLIDGKDADQFIKSLQVERSKPWYQRSGGKEWIRNSILVVAILAVLFLLYMLIVPWLSSKLASKVSVETERQLGDAVYDAMGLAGQEDTAASYVLSEFFAAMDIDTRYDIRITVVKDQVVNAFALPGGRIVVYSALLKQINSYPALAALLSHEFIHINNKHTTKSIFRKLGSKIFLGLLFGRFGNVTAVLVDHADNLKSLSYSRSLEKEADMEGLQILQQRKIDPAGFKDLFITLEKSVPGRTVPEMLASHPDTRKRIDNISEASGKTIVEENQRLKAIFERLNK